MSNLSFTTTTQKAANVFWSLATFLNRVIPAKPMPNPSWATKSLPSSGEREPLNRQYPQQTRSLCPECNKESVNAVMEGDLSVGSFRDNPGLIDATVLEEAGRILMRKACSKHGPYEDLLSIDPAFSKRMNALHPGKDLPCAEDRSAHNHGPLSTKVGRGHFLIIDLTNRCNMKCSPCFMDANHTAYVHEISLEDLRSILTTARVIKPRREISVLLSGGEPTLSPLFLEAIRLAKSFGFRVHVATNGIKFAEDPSFVQQAKEAGLWGVFLQFDGIGEQENAHRGVGNLYAIKLKALQNISEAGMKTTLQVTVVNQQNSQGISKIVEFAALHSNQIHGVIFQPVMFTGRDRDIDDSDRYERRYTLSHLVHDLQEQCHVSWHPMRDWFPSALSSLGGHISDLLHPGNPIGSISYNSHSENEIVSPILVNAGTAEWVPLGSFFDVVGFMNDLALIGNTFRSEPAIKSQVAIAAAKHYDSASAPVGFGMRELFEILQETFHRAGPASSDKSRKSNDGKKWNLIMVAGMWFQDVFNYDLSKIDMSSTPVGTQEGEIDFGTYNGAGWRQIVEYLHKTALVSEWNKTRGRHAIYAHGRFVQISGLHQEKSQHEIVAANPADHIAV